MDAQTKTKKCTKCGENKFFGEFYRNDKYADGFVSRCKSCVINASNQWRQNNPERFRKSLQKWAKNHPGYSRRHYIKNAEKYKVRSRKRRIEEPRKSQAKDIAKRAYEAGRLKKPEFCQRCKEPKRLDRHHPDYNCPLKVEWLCRSCHRKVKKIA